MITGNYIQTLSTSDLTTKICHLFVSISSKHQIMEVSIIFMS